MTRPPDLPDYERPPVVEVGLSVQFEPIEWLNTLQLGKLCERYRDRYPRIEEQPPLPTVMERFGPEGPLRASFQMQVVEYIPGRALMIDPSGCAVIQTQRDRFSYNWRGEGTAYPRYEHVKANFFQELDLFESFLAEHDSSTLRVTQCEATYVNHIYPGKTWTNFSDADRVTSLLNFSTRDRFLVPEKARAAASYVISEDGAPVGRLHVSVEPNLQTKVPTVQMVLTARGSPLGDTGRASTERFLDLGREWIVRGFAALTRSQMDVEWGRRS